MHADGKSTLTSVSKWNSGKVNLKDEKTRWTQKTSLVMIIISLTGTDVQKKLYQMEIQLENMVAHFFGTFPFTQTDLAEN